MKTFHCSILILAVLVASLSKSLICFSFELNRDYISKNLCENRNMPQLHCNGKCHIAKEMSKENNKENFPFSVQNNFDIQLYSEQYAEYNFSLCSLGELQHHYKTDVI